MVKRKKLLKLIRKYLEGTASNKEKEFIERYYQYFDFKDSPSNSFSEMEKQEMESKMLQNIHAGMQQASYKPIVRNHKKIYIRVAAAAMLAILIAGITFLYTYKKETPKVANSVQVRDIAPGGNKAVLTLANGTTVVLDSMDNGKLASQGNVNVVKVNKGHLAYNPISIPHQGKGSLQYNTLVTPRGGQYQLTLSDGTKVWLNAASSIRYPTAFTGKEREVEVTGEVYFEVAKNAAMPFIVEKGAIEVKVLGTHFNINAYDDEAALKVTLLEGLVKVSQLKTKHSKLVHAGQQAKLNKTGQIKIVENIPVNDVVSWKNGFFSFRNANLKMVMRKLSRWYDVDITYEPGADNGQRFSGSIDRSLTLLQILNGLKQTRAHFRIEEGRKVVILP